MLWSKRLNMSIIAFFYCSGVSLIWKLATIAAIATTIAALPFFLSEMAVSHEKEEANDQGKEDEALEVHDKGLKV